MPARESPAGEVLREVRRPSQGSQPVTRSHADDLKAEVESLRARADRGPRAADRHRRDPAGHLELADRCPARVRRRSLRSAARLCDALRCHDLPGRRRRAPPRRSPQARSPLSSLSARVPRCAERPWGRAVLTGGRSMSPTCRPRSTEYPTAACLRGPMVSGHCSRSRCSAGRGHRGDHDPSGRGPAVHRPADRAPGDLRRPGRDRHRERPAVQRDEGGARAADGDERDPARHRELAHGSAAGLGRCRGERGARSAMRRRRRLSTGRRALRFVAIHGAPGRRWLWGDFPARTGIAAGRAVLDRRTVHVEDIPAAERRSRRHARRVAAQRTTLAHR